MFQNYYDEKNNRFLIAPLRCGSSYTNKMASNLGWRDIDDVFAELCKDEANNFGPSLFHTSHYSQNHALKVLYMMKSKKYRNSDWVTFVRNPWTRYISAASLVLQTFDAPSYVPADELTLVDEYLKSTVTGDIRYDILENSPYLDVDKKIAHHFQNSILPDYTLNDHHMVPILTVQLAMYLENHINVRLIRLENMTDFYKEHYKPGETVQEDYYDLLDVGKRDASDNPNAVHQGMYKRFLATTDWYNPVRAKNRGLKASFHNFIQYDIDAWAIFDDPDFDNNKVSVMFEDMFKEPYFFVRNKKLYQFYAVAAGTIPTETQTFSQINLHLPKVRDYIFQNSWINVDVEANF